ncbi:MAG TPA: hypothetical protein VM638_03795 [Actinomycetota bacterium]|nr:hypothetical protein [Actinomycetota bacterium]
MRRTPLLLSLLLVCSIGLAPSPATAAPGEELLHSVTGNIKMFTRFTDGEQGFPGVGRRLYQAARETNGLVSYTFRVDPATWMGRFELIVTGESGIGDAADLGIYFYEDLADAGNSAAVTTASYDVRKPGGEIGYIAPGSRYAIVFMSRGINVDFAYRGFSPMTVEIRDTGFVPADVTVGEGGWIVWKNVGQNFHSVTAPGRFDSSPGTNRPLIPGATFARQFDTVSTISYMDKYNPEASGTIRVVPGPGPGTPAA